ncbi:hypothetical protein ENSA5_10180 [Enhygromyxa salina]|uniref:Lipoprotein n=1 Tax=Enhygromyxa salina TaxID=215803 RepID=A0A2S9YGE6_9BACT|nr:hypothetical protein [Enhygromyxa salina]PRQ04180.1 hypothetical protein ENSA5_10180 [Enhygromyxa salina]
MTRATLLLALVASLSACRPAAPAPAPAPSRPSASSSGAVSEKPRAVEPEAPDEPEAPGEPGAPSEPGAWTAVLGASACELGCADVHDCVVVEGEQSPAAAAAIELSCLDACLAAPDRDPATLYGCERPSTHEAPTCEPFLACVRGAWPDRRSERPPLVEYNGCELACLAFARCYDRERTDQDRDGIQECTRECGEVLDDEQQQAVGACASLSSCEDVIECIIAHPGA